MATFDDYMKAARKAHAAGDADSAKRLVGLAKAAQSETQNSGQNVIAETPDGGRVIKGKDGALSFTSPNYATTDPATIERLMAGEGVKRVVQSTTDQMTISQAPALSRLTKFTEGTPFIGSRVDEAAGAMFGDKSKQGTRDISAAMARERPKESAALQVGGGIAGSVPMAMAALPGISAIAPASRYQQVAAGLLGGAAAGGVEGVVYGSGEGETGAERVENAKRQGKVGAALGGVLGAGAPLVADLTDAALRALKKTDTAQIARQFGLSKPAARVIKQHVDAGDIGSARAALKQAGDEAMLGEATRGSRSLLDATAARGGRAEQVVNDAVEGRVARGNAAFRAASDEAMGAPPQGLLSAADEVSARTAPARKEAYDAAFETPIDYAAQSGRRVEEVLDLVPPKILGAAIADANEDILARELPRNMQILADIADDGSVKFTELPNVQQLDELKKALQRLAYSGDNVNQFGKLNGKGQRYNELAGKLRDAVSDATGGAYGKAVGIGGDKIAEDNALKLGSAILRDSTTRDDVIRMMAGAADDTKNSAKVGMRSALDEAMANVKAVASDRNVDARQVNKAINAISSDAARAKARIILGPKEADTFFAKVDELSTGLSLRADVSENSRTLRRTAINDTLNAATAPNALQSAAAGEPVEATKRIVQLLTGETPDAVAFRQEGVAEEIAQFLTRTKGKSAEAALKYINQAMSGQTLTSAQAGYVANILATSGFLTGNRAGQQSLAPLLQR